MASETDTTSSDHDQTTAMTPVVEDQDVSTETFVVSTDREQESEEIHNQCPICLGSYEDKCFITDCMHAFCFLCILQWSEFNRQCPLCKSSYSYLVHNIASDEHFDKYLLDALSPVNKAKATLPSLAVTARRGPPPSSSAWGTPSPLSDQERCRRDRRRQVYRQRLRAKHVGANPYSRFRDVSPLLFRSNPDTALRLGPWIQRDLHALLGDDFDVTLIKEYLLALIQQVDLRTQEAIDLLYPFLHDHTEAFIHELVSFARSPYNMTTYDRLVQYAQSSPQELKKK